LRQTIIFNEGLFDNLLSAILVQHLEEAQKTTLDPFNSSLKMIETSVVGQVSLSTFKERTRVGVKGGLAVILIYCEFF